MKKLSVRKVKHVFVEDQDIDVQKGVDVKDVDVLIFTCIEAAKDALQSAPPSGYSDFERDQLIHVIDGIRHAHTSIRKLLMGEQSPSAVDALAIARLQIETLYSLCFLLQAPENIRLYLKNGWKKKYVRFLLEREECRELPRFADFLNKTSGPLLDRLQVLSGVSEEERRTIEIDELGAPDELQPGRVPIKKFPTPTAVIDAIGDGTQRRMLARLYPEFEYLCSFAHGDSEASLFRAIANVRSIASLHIEADKIADFYQRQVLEIPFLYSALSAIQAATEITAVYPSDIELLVKVTKAWEFLRVSYLLGAAVWELRAKHVLPLISSA